MADQHNFSAQDVKRLRDETGAPMMECKAALVEANGDYEKAKQVLRERGAAQSGKRAHRSTHAGVVAIAHSADHAKVGAVVLECETDFVARNEKFQETARELAEIFLHQLPGDDPMSVKHGQKSVADLVSDTVALFRENTRLAKALHEEVKSGDRFAVYIHHDNLKACLVEVSGPPEIAGNVGRQVAIQCVAFPPEYVRKEDVPQSIIEAEIETQTKRAVNEGKDEKIAGNIARGRVNKEFLKRVVLLEQPFYKDAEKSVADFVAAEGKGVEIKRFLYLAVGEGD